jgi:hypothetical protein
MSQSSLRPKRAFAGWGLGLVCAVALGVAGCEGTMPAMGGSKVMNTGAAGGATSHGANPQLERCATSLGTVAVVEDQGAPWYSYLANYRLGSTVPVLRMLIQQSNCFVVVERGRGMDHMMGERMLERSGEMRAGSGFGKGQVVAADTP